MATTAWGYQMLGGQMGTLNVWTWLVYFSTLINFWTASGHKDEVWHLARVTVLPNSNPPFELTFQAVIVSSDTGDMAVDDVVVTTGKGPGRFTIPAKKKDI